MSSSLPEERVRDGQRPYCKAPLPAGKDAILADRPKTGRNGSTRWNAILRGKDVERYRSGSTMITGPGYE